MSKATRFAATLSLAGAMLAPSSPSFAQDYVRQTSLAPLAYDNYYNANSLPDGYGSYAAVGPVSSDTFAAIGYAAQPAYTVAGRFSWPGLRGGDWVAIHGSAGR